MSPDVPFSLVSEHVCGVNEPVVLFEGPAVLRTMGLEVPVQCRIHFAWFPNGGAEAILRWVGPPFFGLNNKSELMVPSLGLRTSFTARRSVVSTKGGNTVTALLRGNVQFGNATNLSAMTFSVANFPSMIGVPIVREQQSLLGRTLFIEGPWIVIIDSVADKDYLEQLSDQKGYGLTHAGKIQRSDGQFFSADEAGEILDDLSLTLGFARAAFTGLILRQGYSGTGEKVWIDWNAYRVSPFNNHTTWFSSHKPENLQAVFEGWRRLVNDPNREVIIAAWNLFLDAHVSRLATESRLTLIQSALEGLADGWPYPPAIDFDTYTSQFSLPLTTAARKIAKIGASFNLSIQEPAVLAELAALQQPRAGAPVLDKVTWIRNSIAHLGNFPRLSAVSDMATYQACEYAAWLLELALLRVLSVTGTYQNRLAVQWAGQVEALPWGTV